MCLKSFKTAYSLTMHVEAEGSKCQIRQSESFRPFTDQLTGGVVDVVGIHDDETRKYTISEGIADNWGTGKTPETHVRQALEREQVRTREAMDTHFDRNPPCW